MTDDPLSMLANLLDRDVLDVESAQREHVALFREVIGRPPAGDVLSDDEARVLCDACSDDPTLLARWHIVIERHIAALKADLDDDGD